MSEPRTDYDSPSYGAGIELISAMSALNMEPEPIKDPPEGSIYLSETDRMVRHSMEHMHAAYRLIQRSEKLLENFCRAGEAVLHLCHGIEWEMTEDQLFAPPEWVVEQLDAVYREARAQA